MDIETAMELVDADIQHAEHLLIASYTDPKKEPELAHVLAVAAMIQQYRLK